MEVKKCNIVMSGFKTFFSFFLFKKVSNFKMILSIVLLLGGRVGLPAQIRAKKGDSFAKCKATGLYM